MTLDELIEALEDEREALGTGDGEVLIASQPQWPLTNVIKRVASHVEVVGDQAEHDFEVRGVDNDAVWIAVEQIGREGNISPYAPSAAWG